MLIIKIGFSLLICAFDYNIWQEVKEAANKGKEIALN